MAVVKVGSNLYELNRCVLLTNRAEEGGEALKAEAQIPGGGRARRRERGAGDPGKEDFCTRRAALTQASWYEYHPSTP